MAANSINILLIEDNLAYARLLQEFIKQANSHELNIIHVTYLAEAIKKVSKDTYDIILLDLTLPDSEGLASLAPLMSQAPSIPIVVLTNTNDDELALEAVRRGAQDYLVKREVNPAVLLRSLRYAIERKQVLEQLRVANQGLENRVFESTAELVKAKEINQSKSEFVSMLSHDIRNPLNTIMLAAGLLQNNDEKLPKEKKLSHFQLIRSAIKNMAQLLDEVSFIGKADAGKIQCDFTCFDIEEFCRAIVAEAQLTAAEKQVNIVFYQQGKLDEALWDESLLRHILNNLLSNAIKYSHPGGKVLFEVIAQGKTVIFKIQDRGIGIPQKDQQQIFQTFHRAENVGQIPGTGLGLAIVKKCTEAHGGEISVDSEVGVGTTVTVSLSGLVPEDF
ncbi:MAG: hybrid sensor histidine kinase/response regulator [Nostocaceae cyanobacterium]|nr:hybrid sensor histidine kinase/response regulator [Nostocaceae cyanobacterium]